MTIATATSSKQINVKSKITAGVVRTHARALLTPSSTIAHDDVFDAVLERVPVKFDFPAAANVTDAAKLSKRDQIVLCIEQIVKAAFEAKVGICRHHDFVYAFNGEFWRRCDEDHLMQFLGKAAERMGVPRLAAKFYATRESLLRQFRADAYLPTPKRKDGVTLLNCRNGTFEITDQQQRLREFRRDDFLTYVLPFAFDPKATCPKWDAYLARVLPDESRQKVLAEFIGWCFTDLKLEKALFLFGDGANGKSVFFEVMTALLGAENVTHYSIASLADDRGYQRAKIADALLNYASEIGSKVESEHFKKLVSREPVEARLPYGQPFLLTRYARLAFNANELPRDVEHNAAFFRRFLVIPFDETIPAKEQNKTLHTEIIRDELPGVFNWVLEGLRRLLKQKGFTPCDAAEKAVEAYRRESDSVAMFLEEEGFKPSCDSTVYESLVSLHRAYREFCKDAGYIATGRIKFSKRLKSLGYTSERATSGMRFFIERG